jgi:hypothetical protein
MMVQKTLSQKQYITKATTWHSTRIPHGEAADKIADKNSVVEAINEEF